MQRIQAGGRPLARTNFSFQKRQKELERKKKQEEKRERRLAKKAAKAEAADASDTPPDADTQAEQPAVDDPLQD
jgi:hypothetical protein